MKFSPWNFSAYSFNIIYSNSTFHRTSISIRFYYKSYYDLSIMTHSLVKTQLFFFMADNTHLNMLWFFLTMSNLSKRITTINSILWFILTWIYVSDYCSYGMHKCVSACARIYNIWNSNRNERTCSSRKNFFWTRIKVFGFCCSATTGGRCRMAISTLRWRVGICINVTYYVRRDST